MSTLDACGSPTQSRTGTDDDFEIPSDEKLYGLAYKHIDWRRNGETWQTFGPTYNGYAGSLAIDSGMTTGVWVNKAKGTKGTWKETAMQGASSHTGKDTRYQCFQVEGQGRGVEWGVNERRILSGEKRVITEQEMPESVQLAWQKAGSLATTTKPSPSASTYAAPSQPQTIRTSIHPVIHPNKTPSGLPGLKFSYGPEEPRRPSHGFTTEGILKGPTTEWDREVRVGRGGNMRRILCADGREGIYDPEGGGQWTRQNMSHQWCRYKVPRPDGKPELSVIGLTDRVVGGPGWEWDCVEGADGPVNVKSFKVDPISGDLIYRSHQDPWEDSTS